MRKKLILFNPETGRPLQDALRRVLQKEYPPALTILEAMTPGDYEIARCDQPFFVRYEPGLVAITALTMNIHVAYRHADRFRKAGAKVVMGGPHVTFRPEEALEHCDAVCVGEAETVWRRILRDYENGSLERVYEGKPANDFWEYYQEGLLKLEPRQIQGAILATRGCRFNCRFCVVSSFFKFRRVPIPRVVELIRASRTKAFTFHDPNIFSDPAHAKELFRALIPLDIRFNALSSVDLARDEEALDLARRGGCRRLFIGFETITPEVVVQANGGKLRREDDYRALIRRIREKGIRIQGSFIVGFDEDDPASLWRLLVFCLTSRLQEIDICILTPFPGTELYRRLEAEGRITSRDWRRYDVDHLVFSPKRLSPALLRAWVLLCFMLTNRWMLLVLLVLAFNYLALR